MGKRRRNRRKRVPPGKPLPTAADVELSPEALQAFYDEKAKRHAEKYGNAVLNGLLEAKAREDGE